MKRLSILFCLVVLVIAVAIAQTNQTISKATLDRGKEVFVTTCLACHQANGGGVPHLNPPLIKSPFVVVAKSKLITIVLKGLNEEIEVDGDFYNNPMPSFAQLTDQQIADVLTYVRNNFQNKASAITVAQVKAERAKLK